MVVVKYSQLLGQTPPIIDQMKSYFKNGGLTLHMILSNSYAAWIEHFFCLPQIFHEQILPF